jgi:polysaccharide biosynthesis transport protein
MSVEFRQRTPGEYLQIVWRRKWLIILPAIAMTLAFAWVARRLPDIYESTSLLVIRPATISPSIVQTLNESDLQVRINTIGQEVMSRSNLLPLIQRYDLYAQERARGESIDVLIERMQRDDVKIDVVKGREDITNAFVITFRGRDRRTTQAVTSELASKYVNAQTNAATASAIQTREYFEGRVREAREALDAIDQRRREFMQQNTDNLPDFTPALVGQLTGLREQQRTLTTELGRLRDQRTMLSNRIAEVTQQRQQEIDNLIQSVTDPRSTEAYANLVQQKIRLQSELETMLTMYREANPAVREKRAEIATVEREMQSMIREHEERVAQRRRFLEGQPDGRTNDYQANLRLVEGELARKERELGQIAGQISNMEMRLNSVPGASVTLGSLDREYQTQQAVYNDLLEKQELARLQNDVVAQAQGQTIAVIDSASLPDKPVAPNRMLLVALGLALGLGVGAALAAAVEIPRLLTVQTRQDAEHYTNLPVLISVPQLLTPVEKRRLRLRQAAFACAGLIATVISIPTMIVILRFTHILETLSQRS